MSAGRELAQYQPGRPLALESSPTAFISGPRRVGHYVIAAFLGSFVAWGGLAPLAGGAVAPGRVAPDGSVRLVQHLEGGIVRELFVEEGDVVEAGAPLVALERVAPQADVEALLDRRRARLAEAARLDAEMNGRDAIAFPGELTADDRFADILAAERHVFEARKAMRTSRERVLRQRMLQLSEQIVGLEAQSTSAVAQLDFIQQEIRDKTILYEQGLTPKTEMYRLWRSEAEIQGFWGEYNAQIAQARQQIGETRIELLALEAEWLEQVSQRASVVRGELVETEQALAASRDVLNRTVVSAPVAGVVNNLRIKTVGGVVGAGEEILDLVPTEEKLVVDAEVSPTDIDIVKLGLPAIVHLTALSGRSTPRLAGLVKFISADLLVDESTQQAYYSVRVEVAKEDLEATDISQLTIGMPVEVIIVSEERTALEYLINPITDAIRRAGREA